MCIEKQTNPYLVAPIDGFTPQMGRLVSMMNYSRRTTLDAVKGLDGEQLDYLHDPQSNSIGALLLHIAAVELWYQEETFGSRADMGEAEQWEIALDLGSQARSRIKGNDLSYYLRILETVRSKTLEELAARDDSWLDEESEFWNRQPANNYFKWFHVFEDEINHRGQIRWLRKRVGGE